MSDGDTAKKLFSDGLSHLDAHNFAAAETRFIETLKLAPQAGLPPECISVEE
jgi:hypothetical protein